MQRVANGLVEYPRLAGARKDVLCDVPEFIRHTLARAQVVEHGLHSPENHPLMYQWRQASVLTSVSQGG